MIIGVRERMRVRMEEGGENSSENAWGRRWVKSDKWGKRDNES